MAPGTLSVGYYMSLLTTIVTRTAVIQLALCLERRSRKVRSLIRGDHDQAAKEFQ